MRPFRRYLNLVLGGGFAATVAVFAYAAVTGHLPANFWAFHCSADGYDGDAFLSQCGHPAWAVYEHGAYLLASEPGAVAAIRQADVVFLGASRTQAAFSNPVTAQWFAERGLRHYLAGFSGDADVFARRLIVKLDLRPKVAVINADYFFTRAASPWALKVLGETPAAQVEHRMKAAVQPLHEALCTGGGVGLATWLCGDRRAIYRSRATGDWIWVPEPLPEAFDIRGYVSDVPTDQMPRLLAEARDFAAMLRERGICPVITVVPSNAPQASNEAVARLIAAEIGADLVLPDPSGLRAVDENHLGQRSGEIWSRRFFALFEMPLGRCLGR